MAQFHVKGVDALLKELNALGSMDLIAPKMLEEAVPILQNKVVEKANEHRDTGAMVASIKPTKPTRGKSGYEVIVRPTGKDKKGVRNMEKMMYLEYGVKGRAAIPMITAAVIEAEPAVLASMRATFEKEISKR